MKRILCVGAGFAGAVIARELSDAGFRVDVIDARNHIAGNAYDYWDTNGILVHKYGPHLFHTNNDEVVEWLSRFTEWTPYFHKVKAQLGDGRYVTLPVNRETKEIVGEENILDTFFRPYSRKMWGKELEELDPSIISRVPIRDDDNELYFPNDKFQAMPRDGYTVMFRNILSPSNISTLLGEQFKHGYERSYDYTFNSMPIDEYFNFKFGELPYRSIKFKHVSLDVPKALPTAVVNFTHDGPYTRVTEWKNIPGHGNNDLATSLMIEKPCDYKSNNMERYYPVKDLDGKNREIYRLYDQEANKLDNMKFIGRCGTYQYLDMHIVIAQSLKTAREFIAKEKS